MEALGVIEGQSLAKGLRAIDLCIKKAPLFKPTIRFVSPGKFVLWMGGSVAEVEESTKAGLDLLGDDALSHARIYGPHPQLLEALGALESASGVFHKLARIEENSVGVLEWDDLASAMSTIDAILKGMNVTLIFVRLAKGIGGRTLVMFHGDLAEIEAAMSLARAGNSKIREAQIIARPDPLWLGCVKSWLETPF